MTVSLKHKFTSGKSDVGDTSLVRPSNWNDEHDLLMATSRLLGRTTAGAGAAEEISAGTGLTLSSGTLSVTTNTYQPLDTELTALAGLVSAADTAPYFTGSGTAALFTITAAGRAILDDADAAAQRTTLGAAASGANTDITSVYLDNGGLKIKDTNASHGLIITPGSDLSADRALTLTTGDAARTVTISGNATISQDYSTGGSPQFTGIELGNASDTTITRASAGVVAVEGVNLARTTDVVGQQTIWVPAAAMYTRTTNGAATGTVETATNRIMLKTLDFDTTTQEFAQFAIQMPKGWNESTLVCQFVWGHAATTVNFGVAWAIEAVAFADDDAADTAFGTAVQVTDTGGTTNDVYITAETGALTVAGTPAAEEWVVFQVKRVPADAADTMAIDARLLGVKVHYTTDAAKDD